MTSRSICTPQSLCLTRAPAAAWGRRGARRCKTARAAFQADHDRTAAIDRRPRRGPGRSCASPASRSCAPRSRRERYLADDALCTALFVALALGQPLLLEGEAGVGKTEVAKALAAATGARLIRLQCHEGIDVHQALYDWDYERQLLAIRRVQALDGGDDGEAGTDLYDRRFLVRRPLLEALEADAPVVLLIDELDRADDEFEAFLLELLSDFQVTIPEIGTIAAARRPRVILTSNRTRELHVTRSSAAASTSGIDYPASDRSSGELEIVAAARAASAPAQIVDEGSCRAVALLRGQELYKRPGVGETIAWAQARSSLLGSRRTSTRRCSPVLKVPRGHRAGARGRLARWHLTPPAAESAAASPSSPRRCVADACPGRPLASC